MRRPTAARELEELSRIARELVVLPDVAPAASVAVARRGTEGWEIAVGAAGQRSRTHGEPIGSGTPFDLASVTKPFVAVAAARLAALGGPLPDAPLGALLSEARGTPSETVELDLLTAHRAGLEAHRPLFAVLTGARALDRSALLREAAGARRAGCVGAPPEGGFPPLYSDLGYLLLGEAVSRAAATPLDRLIEREICVPLQLDAGSSRDWLVRDPTFVARVAPTEHVAWRGGELVGVVHDENAWSLAGHGLAGHAGLFGTAQSVALFGAAVLDALAGRRPEWLAPEAARRLVRQRPGGSLRAGFDGLSPEGSSAGSRCGPATFGHLGFTGTSLWCDPDAEAVLVLLTNRVNPTREDTRIRTARPRVHDALFQLVERGW